MSERKYRAVVQVSLEISADNKEDAMYMAEQWSNEYSIMSGRGYLQVADNKEIISLTTRRKATK
jgi:uncharacterized membrane-anchored protein YitT (DUF2179 family)